MTVPLAPIAPPPRRSRSRTAWLVGGSLLTIVTVAWGLVQTVGVLGRSTDRVEVTRSADGIEELLVEVAGGSVEIRGTDRDEIRVTGTVTSGLTSTRHDEQVEGDRFVVSSACTGGPVSTFCAVDHLIEVPQGLAVVVRSDDTAVTLSGLAGSIDVETSAASIDGEQLSGPELRLRTSDANVSVRGVSTPIASVRSSNGDVDMSFDEPTELVEVDTSEGAIRLVLPDTPDPYAVDVATSNGAETVSVRTDPVGERRIVARSSNADVSVTYPDGA
jgi:hypothetical protein